MAKMAEPREPPPDCPLCPRLAAFRHAWREREPTWFNSPVPSFGPKDARLLIVGLAPGLQGANRTGRPFTGDYAGVLLYETLLRYRFARGEYQAHPDGTFLRGAISEMQRLSVIVALGRIAHDSVLAALEAKRSQFAFGHGARHAIGTLALCDSYHCSRYNTNTGVLTPEMFRAVFAEVRRMLDR
jgi:uracil-DNA glycosylase